MRVSNHDLLVHAGLRYKWREHEGGPGIRALLTGKPHPFLEKMATRHARYMAEHQEGGHQHWGSRRLELLKHLPRGFQVSEDACSSWPWQNRHESAPEVWWSFERSEGHWKDIQRRVIYYGLDMKRGADNIHYACMILATK